jgi:ComF family protein
VLRTWLQRWALPQHCVLCGAVGDMLCQPCHDDLPGLRFERCPSCGAAEVRSQVCGQCLAHPPRFSKVAVAASYGFPLDAVIKRFKYGRDLSLVAPLAALLSERVANEMRPDYLVSMPLSAERLRERGFNQSQEIAHRVAGQLGLAIAPAICRRIRNTPPQADLPLSERRGNIRGAFSCAANLDGARIAVVDDVLTSGASLNELARTLLRAGAAEVMGWIVARTER